jgi:dolichol kinase
MKFYQISGKKLTDVILRIRFYLFAVLLIIHSIYFLFFTQIAIQMAEALNILIHFLKNMHLLNCTRDLDSDAETSRLCRVCGGGGQRSKLSDF